MASKNPDPENYRPPGYQMATWLVLGLGFVIEQTFDHGGRSEKGDLDFIALQAHREPAEQREGHRLDWLQVFALHQLSAHACAEFVFRQVLARIVNLFEIITGGRVGRIYCRRGIAQLFLSASMF